MPTYDYRCKACGHEFEEFQSMSAAHLKKCPSCGKLKLERLIGTGAALIFKGGGFYETDYRSDSYKKAAEADSKPKDSSSTGAAATEGKAQESKPAGSTPSESKSEPAKPAARESSKESKADTKPAKADKPSKPAKGGK